MRSAFITDFQGIWSFLRIIIFLLCYIALYEMHVAQIGKYSTQMSLCLYCAFQSEKCYDSLESNYLILKCTVKVWINFKHNIEYCFGIALCPKLFCPHIYLRSFRLEKMWIHIKIHLLRSLCLKLHLNDSNLSSNIKLLFNFLKVNI